MLLEANQHLTAGSRQFWVRQLGIGPSLHVRHGLSQLSVCRSVLRGPGFGDSPLTLVVIQIANSSHPREGSLFIFRPAFAETDEVAPNVCPAKNQQHVA